MRRELYSFCRLEARPRQSESSRVSLISFVVILCVLVTAMSTGCSTESRHRMLSVIFEDVPEPGQEVKPKPVINKPRRQPLKRSVQPIPPVKLATLPVIDPEKSTPRDWREFERQMPKDASGNVDWVRALEDKAIEPKAGLDPASALQPVFPLDVERVPAGQPLFKVTFPHKAHTEWLACVNCHPVIFEMRRGANPINMAKIYAGEYCGQCHGKVSFAVPTGCPRCHLALAGPK